MSRPRQKWGPKIKFAHQVSEVEYSLHDSDWNELIFHHYTSKYFERHKGCLRLGKKEWDWSSCPTMTKVLGVRQWSRIMKARWTSSASDLGCRSVVTAPGEAQTGVKSLIINTGSASCQEEMWDMNPYHCGKDFKGRKRQREFWASWKGEIGSLEVLRKTMAPCHSEKVNHSSGTGKQSRQFNPFFQIEREKSALLAHTGWFSCWKFFKRYMRQWEQEGDHMEICRQWTPSFFAAR